MEYKEFGNTGFKVSPFGLGTYYDPGWIAAAKLFGVRRGREQHVKAIRTGIEMGINLIDTAEIYGTEQLVSEAIKASGAKREDLFIATKVWRSHLRRDDLIKACHRSLRELNTDYIDLYQIHFPNSRIQITETMSAMEELQRQGKIRYIGISNFKLKGMIEAENALKDSTVTSTQMHYNVVHRDIEKDIIPHCIEKKIAVLAYYPLAHGKLGSDTALPDKIGKISKSHGGKTLSQITLNWFYSKYSNVFPIPRASNPEHVKENCGSSNFFMSTEEIALFEESVRSI